MRRLIISTLPFLILSTAIAAPLNVLFIAVDDMKVELNCYGQKHVISPNIDRLAQRGTLFERAYCQQTVCNPSRASVMTGLRPDTLKVWDLPTHFRTHHPDVVTLPQLFMKNGYFAQGIGKIFHNWRQDDWKGDEVSWSVPSFLHYATHGADRPQVEGELPPDHASGKRSSECRDVPDEAYYDGRIAEKAVTTLRALKKRTQPFFLAVGFWKPHLPFNAPKKYWDMYDRKKVPLPRVLTPPNNAPAIALTNDRINAAKDRDLLRELSHGHLAAMTYLDTQIGKVLNELDALELRDNTIVVFWSDHGLHLGEHGLLRKTTVFDVDARVPMIISSPKHRGGRRTSSLVELLDLYPTLADLCGLKPPANLEGKSLVPVLKNPNVVIKAAALTQTPRPNYPRGKMPQTMGYSIRAGHYRYTEWREFASGRITARELYDHRKDPGETRNVIADSTHAKFLPKLAEQLSVAADVRRLKSADTE